jgi:type II secretory pathway predicted ATPase ExeA
MSEYHAFSERIGNEVALRPLNEEKIRSLIVDYLSAYCKDGKSVENPFTDEAIEVILQRSQGNIRRTISLCGRAIDIAVDEQKDRVDQECVEAVLAS